MKLIIYLITSEAIDPVGRGAELAIRRSKGVRCSCLGRFEGRHVAGSGQCCDS
jgi:hypothetical protein